jgi:8-oxo-dGTP diphosphatase
MSYLDASRKQCTLVIIHQGSRILLSKKKKGFGAGKLNGPGGKLNPNESIIECALRETNEEFGITLTDAKLRGRIIFTFLGGYQEIETHLVYATEFTGVPKESEEMSEPSWYDVSAIPYDSMWPDDAHWLPLLLGDPSMLMDAEFTFQGHDKIVSFKINQVTELVHDGFNTRYPLVQVQTPIDIPVKG